MLRRRSEVGSTTVALSLAVFLVLMTVVTVYIFMAKVWWFPPAITEFGHEIDDQFGRTLLITGIVFVLAQFGLAYAVFKFRDQGQKATYFEGNNTMEIVWTLATVVLFVGLGLYARNAWAQVHFQGAAEGALPIEITAQQFVWNFRYAGPDGKFGREKPELVSASTGNPVGLDSTDPASKDDIVAPVIAVPVNREIELIIRSQDVTHSFYVRELRLKQDAVPGMEIHMHFNAAVPGNYEIACAELCGLGHYRMHSMLQVMAQEDFDKWVKDQEAANQ
ncbi:MAG: cytochrome c oxidase subunit II [Acidobacteriia bacterium]|nr:cytochrome c oxidase subunit II [Terriglobia bacterium]